MAVKGNPGPPGTGRIRPPTRTAKAYRHGARSARKLSAKPAAESLRTESLMRTEPSAAARVRDQQGFKDGLSRRPEPPWVQAVMC